MDNHEDTKDTKDCLVMLRMLYKAAKRISDAGQHVTIIADRDDSIEMNYSLYGLRQVLSEVEIYLGGKDGME